MKRKLSFLFLAVLFSTLTSLAQTAVKGTVVDQDTREPLIGVTIFDPVSKKALATTDLDGSFALKATAGKDLEVSYIGYVTQTVKAAANLGTIELKSSSIGLNDVVVTSSVAIRRKTPVALSVIDPEMIETKLGTQEFPEILKSTPGVYATKQGGGYGDSRINLRGFESANIAVMINGVPMNDMEWGGIYWSNFAGLSDVTRSMQVQRGLGASKVAAPSIGGSINIVTKSTDMTKGGSVSYGMGGDGYNKIGFSVSTGLLKNGWAVTLLGSKTWGDGYIQGTEFDGYSYFLNVAKIINDKHQLSFTAFGAPQTHNQRYRYDRLTLNEWQRVQADGMDKYKYNPSYGFDENGQRVHTQRNKYHKPQLSLNHSWTIDSKSSLSTSFYVSIGDGGGNSTQGDERNALKGTSTGLLTKNYTYTDDNDQTITESIRTPEGYFDFGPIRRRNAASENGSKSAIAYSRNNHFWTGLLSTYTRPLTDEIDFYGGIDLRYYQGLHDAKLVDLLGGKFFVDPSRRDIKDQGLNNLGYINEKLQVGDVVYRDNTGYVVSEGVFAQAEYNKNALSVFVSGSLSNNTYWKVDRMYYTKGNQKSDVKSFLGFNAKTGANYNLNENHNVFVNTGVISRAPFVQGGYFLNMMKSNSVNKDAVNEKAFSAELGYGFRSRYFTANVNVYYTKWIDKTMTAKSNVNDDVRINLTGVDARHQGIELDFLAKPVKNLEITGMLSLGDWIWASSASGYAYDNGKPITEQGAETTEGAKDHYYAQINLKDVKVGNSAQTTFALGARYKFLEDWTIGSDVTFYGRNYSDFVFSAGKNNAYRTPWRIPSAAVMDLNANYKFKLAGLRAVLSGNINNLLNQEYITDATDNAASDPASTPNNDNVSVMYGFGRTYSLALKVRF